MELNEMQQLAVNTIHGPLLILAGAGSGKTTVLVYRTENMIKHGIKPENILALAFTNKAANEMEERIMKLLGKEVTGKISISTFHAFCMRVLREDGDFIPEVGSNYTIASSTSIRQHIKSIIDAFSFEKDDDLDFFKPAYVLRAISLLKNELMLPNEILAWVGKKEIPEHVDIKKVSFIVEKEIGKKNFKSFVKIYMAYQKALKRDGCIDLEDILYYTAQLFLKHPKVLDKYQERFTHILIDEYQDTNQAQYITLKRLAEKYQNFAAVGDDDQSIFGFRGSDIRNILNFETDYPNALSIKLEKNYRSTQTILKAANELIHHNEEKKDKQLYTSNEEGEKIKYFEVEYNTDEAEKITEKIKYLVNQGKKYRDIAVFYRNNSDSSSLERVFKKEGIPFKLSKDGGFFDQTEIVDMIKYLTFIDNPSDASSFSRIINKPKRGIGKTTIDKMLELAHSKSLLVLCEDPSDLQRVNQKTKEGLKEFSSLINRLIVQKDSLSVSDLLVKVIETTQYESSFEEMEESIKKVKRRNLKKLITEAQEMETKNSQLTVHEFLKDVTKKDIDSELTEDEDWDEINLSTVHSAKGREFETVFMIGMYEGSFPSQYALSKRAIEEERRLAYVAFTRAKKELYLSRTLKRLEKDDDGNKIEIMNQPSRFLSEFDQSLIEKI